MQRYCFDTQLDFGKHKSKTIKQLIDENEFSYLLWCLKNHDGVCYEEEVFHKIKDKDIPSSELIMSIVNGDKVKEKIIEERDILQLEVINLKKMLSIYKNKKTASASINSAAGYEDYYEQEKINSLTEAAGTADPETMNDVYWNLD